MPVGDRWTPRFSARSGTHVAWTRHGYGYRDAGVGLFVPETQRPARKRAMRGAAVIGGLSMPTIAAVLCTAVA